MPGRRRRPASAVGVGVGVALTVPVAVVGVVGDGGGVAFSKNMTTSKSGRLPAPHGCGVALLGSVPPRRRSASTFSAPELAAARRA